MCIWQHLHLLLCCACKLLSWANGIAQCCAYYIGTLHNHRPIIYWTWAPKEETMIEGGVGGGWIGKYADLTIQCKWLCNNLFTEHPKVPSLCAVVASQKWGEVVGDWSTWAHCLLKERNECKEKLYSPLDQVGLSDSSRTDPTGQSVLTSEWQQWRPQPVHAPCCAENTSFVYVCSTRRPFVAAHATHWSLAVGDGEGIYNEWCSGGGGWGLAPWENVLKTILFMGQLWIIQNTNVMNVD